MQGMLLAAIQPDNTPHGNNLTFAFPMLMFIIVAGALYLRFRGTHRVPGHVAPAESRWARSGEAGTVAFGDAPASARAEPQAEAHGTTAAEPGAAEEPVGAESAAATEAKQAKPADEGTEDGE